MLSRSPSSSIMLVALGGALVTITMVAACASEEVGPADSGDISDGVEGLGGNATTNRVGSSSSRGGSLTNGSRASGGAAIGQGGARNGTGRGFGEGGSSTRRIGQGGLAMNQGGLLSFLQGGAPAEGQTCRGNVKTGDRCNPEFDTEECRRQTRVCQCAASTREWTCSQSSGGAGGASPSAGGQGPGTGGGLAGSGNASQNLAGTTSTATHVAGQPSISVAGQKSR